MGTIYNVRHERFDKKIITSYNKKGLREWVIGTGSYGCELSKRTFSYFVTKVYNSHIMIPNILKIILYPLYHLGKRWMDNKLETEQFEKKIRLKVLEKEETAMKYTQIRMAKSWTDEACVLWVIVFLSFNFIPYFQPFIAQGIINLENLPDYMRYIIIGAFTASLGLAGFSKYKRVK